MKRHAKTECGNDAKNFECKICLKRFRRKYHLQRHHASVHFSLLSTESTASLTIKHEHQQKQQQPLSMIATNQKLLALTGFR